MSARIRRTRPAGLPFSPVLMRDEGRPGPNDAKLNYYADTYSMMPTHLRVTPSGQIAWKKFPVSFKQRKNNIAATPNPAKFNSKKSESSDTTLILAPKTNQNASEASMNSPDDVMFAWQSSQKLNRAKSSKEMSKQRDSRPRVKSALVTNRWQTLTRPQSSSFPTRNVPFSNFLIRHKIGRYIAADSRCESRLSTDPDTQQNEEEELSLIFQELLIPVNKIEPDKENQKNSPPLIDNEINKVEKIEKEENIMEKEETQNLSTDHESKEESPIAIIPIYPNASFSKTSPAIVKQFLDSNFKLADSHASMLVEENSRSKTLRFRDRTSSASPTKMKSKLKSATDKRQVDYDTLSLASTSTLMNLKSSSKPHYSRLYTGSTVIKPIIENKDSETHQSAITKQNGCYLRFSHSARLFQREENSDVNQSVVPNQRGTGPITYSTNFFSPTGFYSARYPINEMVNNQFYQNDPPNNYNCSLCSDYAYSSRS